MRSVDDTEGTFAPPDWAGWRLDPEVLVLTHPGGVGGAYEVDLERSLTATATLDWIAQVAGKRWATAECLGGLVRALDEVLDLQSNLCSFGMTGGTGERSLTAGDVRVRAGRVAASHGF